MSEASETYTAADQQIAPAVRTLPPLRVEINIDRLELGDIMLLDDVAQDRPYQLVEVIRMLDRVIEGGVKGRPISQFRPLLGRILGIVQELANPKETGSG